MLAEARRSYTTLSLFGYRVDGVVANRVFPDGVDDAWRSGWVKAQAAVLARVAESFSGLPVWRSVYRPSEPVGLDVLASLAEGVYAGADPLGAPIGPDPLRTTRDDGRTVLHLALPHVSREDVHLARNGDELVVTVGSYRRLLTLPAGLSRQRSPAPGSRGRAAGAVRGEDGVSEDEVGSLGEEAAKLMTALAGWARACHRPR
ncbi:MAG: ArsA-related P-loop ATPase [Nocardioides sp.]